METKKPTITQPDEVYAWAMDILKSGTSIEVLRGEVEAAIRFREEYPWLFGED